MDFAILDTSVRVGLDLLVRGMAKSAWLERVEPGENVLDAHGARFRIFVERDGAGDSFVLRVQALPEAIEGLDGFRLRLELGLPEACTEFFAPGIFYRDNRHTYGAAGFMISDRWVFREDRLSTRSVAALDPSGEGFVLMRLDRPKFEPPAVSHRKKCGGFLLPSCEFDLGSIGFDRRRTRLEAFLPAWEGDLRYYEKCRLTPPLGWFYPPARGRPLEAVYLVEAFKGDVYGLLERMIELAWEHQVRADVREPDFSAAKGALVESLKTRYFESRKIAGMYSWVKTFTGEPALGVCEPGFTGMVFLSCARMLDYAVRAQDEGARRLAASVLDSWCKRGFMKGGFVPDFWAHWVGAGGVRVRLDMPVVFEPPFMPARYCSVRRLSEAAWGLVEAAQLTGSALWLDSAQAICDRLASLQADDGSFPRQAYRSGRVRDPECGATPSVLLALAAAQRTFGSRYVDALREAGEFVAGEMVGGFEFYGSTLDSDCEDKEASLIAAVALWEAARILDSDELRQAAYRSAVAALSWFFLWEPVLPTGSLLEGAGLHVSGLGAVSSENNHVDVFLFDYPSVLREIASSFGNPMLAELAQLILYRAVEYVPKDELGPLELGGDEVFLRVGVVPELVYHTDWTYYHLPILVKHRHLAQGFVNPRSAGWCSASLLQAVSSWCKSEEGSHEVQG